MNVEEFCEIIFDFENCMLVKVDMVDVGVVDEMFCVLMGDKVELWCEFIEWYVLEVKNLDV